MICLAMVLTGCGKDIECPEQIECADCTDVMVTAAVSPDATYYCESRDIESECVGFSKYVHPQGKCLNPNGNLICREGWELKENVEPQPFKQPLMGKDYECLPKDKGGCQV